MRSADIRTQFIEFFKSKDHTFVPSSSTIPVGDQTILFTIAGMAQFKSALTGEEQRPYKRATNSQKCIRIGDLDDVGKDGRHLTMFEMLGSWSFGDYYKNDAIKWAYDLTKDVLKFDLNKLWITVHHTDKEAEDIWKKTGVPADRIVELGDKDNFWAMGPTGPCGPCSELHIDQGIEVGKCNVKGYPCTSKPGCDCDRFLEFWNLVFMQYDRQEDGTLVELPKKSVDTGSGLERVTALLQGKTNCFEIDSFQNIQAAIKQEIGLMGVTKFSDAQQESFNVISDHIRTLAFTLADGANFSNEGRGYVLRRVLRRAVRHAHKLNPNLSKSESFLAKVVPSVVKEFGDFYPELVEYQTRVQDLISHEESRFKATLERGIEKFKEFVEDAKKKGLRQFSGEQIFILHDSFGFPSDLTRVMCEEIGYSVDLEGFKKAMAGQKEKSRLDAKFYKFDADPSPWIEFGAADQASEKTFVGYHYESPTGAMEGRDVVSVDVKTEHVRRVRQLKNNNFELVLANTPFYPEGGGQVADSGWIVVEGKGDIGKVTFEVIDVRKTPSAIVHVLSEPEWSQPEAQPIGETKLKTIFSSSVKAVVDLSSRLATARNHTATHLLHKALQVVLGDSVRQAGSLVGPTTLRFDFSHHKAVSPDELLKIEKLVNDEILKDTHNKTHVDMPIADAKKMGAMAMFDEKYEDKVRVMEVPGFSIELCGGTHVSSTGKIGLFKILSEGSVTSGVRRIEGTTGWGVYNHLAEIEHRISVLATEAKCAPIDLNTRVVQMRDQLKESESHIAKLQSKLVNAQLSGLMKAGWEIKPGTQAVAAQVDAMDTKELELYVDRLKEKNVGVVVLGANVDGKVVVLSAVNPQLTKEHKNLVAGQIVKQVCELVDGKGGGRPDFARGGGTAVDKLPLAIGAAKEIVSKLL